MIQVEFCGFNHASNLLMFALTKIHRSISAIQLKYKNLKL